MAAVARPGGSEARVPCPMCGGLVHPVAGRCKHCRADLREHRIARPAAAVALPPLTASAIAPPAPAASVADAADPPTLLRATPPPAAIPAPIASLGTGPILPPRPTASGDAVAPRARWRSWPVAAITVACVAIAGSLTALYWPSCAPGSAAGKQAAPGPAPDRMDTQPLPEPKQQAPVSPAPVPQPPPPTPPPSSPNDPWAGANGALSPPAPDPYDDQQQQAPKHSGVLDADFMQLATAHLCKRAATCGIDDPMMTAMCEVIDAVPPSATSSCPAAQRCLEHIDHMSCAAGEDLRDLPQLFTMFSACRDALSC